MSQAKNDDTVKVHYTGTLADGTVFDSSRDQDPMEFTVGGGELIKGFDEAVVGMAVGDSKTINIAAADAYGAYRDDLVFNVDKGQFPEGADPEVGQQFQTQTEDGSPFMVVVKEVNGEEVTLDANHPLAGQDLTFDIELMEIG